MPGVRFVPTQLNDLVVDVALSGAAQGDVLYRGSAKWNNLAAGSAGKYLRTGGASANPAWASIAESEVTGLVSDLGLKATDSLVVHQAGTETVTGAKTFSAAAAFSATVMVGSPVLFGLTAGDLNLNRGGAGNGTGALLFGNNASCYLYYDGSVLNVFGKTQVAGPASGTSLLLTDQTTCTLEVNHGNLPIASTVVITGTAGSNLALGTNSTPWWYMPQAGHWLAATDNTNDIGAAGATRPRNIFAAGGVCIKTKAGVPADGDFTNPTDGMLCLDTSDLRLYARSGGAWHYAALT